MKIKTTQRLFSYLLFSLLLFPYKLNASSNIAGHPAPTGSSTQYGLKEIESGRFLGTGEGGLQFIIGIAINAFLTLIGIVLLGLIIYGGYTWMTAAGNEEKVTDAKKTLTQAIIGLIIVLSAFAITRFILIGLGAR